jgi:rhodanese-related sulfurtransferase
MTFEDLTPILIAVAILTTFHFVRQFLLGPTISPIDLAARLSDEDADIALIDVRSEGEFIGQLGHIPGAVNIPVGDMADEIKAQGAQLRTDPDKLFVTICRTHNRSPRAARMLKNAGLKNVIVLKGGMMSWAGKKLPTEH